MKRIAAATLAFSLSAASGSALASHDIYGYDGGDGNDDANSNVYNNARYDTAQVVSVSPIVERDQQVQRGECWGEPQRGANSAGNYGHPQYTSGPNGGTVLGAIIGGALGNLAGKGDGRQAATIAGAVIGGAIGHSVANDHRYNGQTSAQGQYGDGDYSNAQPCRPASSYDQEERVVGYHVAFEYNGQVYNTTTSHHPGSTLRVRVDVTVEDDRVTSY